MNLIIKILISLIYFSNIVAVLAAAVVWTVFIAAETLLTFIRAYFLE
jgi:hypothetical protein